MPEHVDIVNADCHEPKHITDATGADAGKVITPSATAGVSELRKLTRSEINKLSQSAAALTVSNNTTGVSMTAAADSTLATNTDYVQYTQSMVAGSKTSDVTTTASSITVPVSGLYRFEMYANAQTSVAATTIAFKFAINGVISLIRRPKNFMRNSGEFHNVAGMGLGTLNAGDVVTLWWASDKNATVTVEDLVFMVSLVQET